MKKIKILILVMLLSTSIFSDDNKLVVIQNLQSIENLYFKYLTFDERKEAVELLNNTISIIQNSNINNNNISVTDDKFLLNEESFIELLNNVADEMDGDTQKKQILSIGKSGYITCYQLYQLMNHVIFDRSKVELIKDIYNNIYDPVNLVSITPLISNSITRRELEDWLSIQ